MRFAGKQHKPVDFVEIRYEQMTSPDLIFSLHEEARTFGSRASGAPVRNKLNNLLRMCESQRIIVDCVDIPLVSSSFADASASFRLAAAKLPISTTFVSRHIGA